MFKPTSAKSVEDYIKIIEEPRRGEIENIDEFIRKTVPSLKRHFATNMIGYGSFHYKSRSGREGDWPVIALASQKNYISVYVCAVKDGQYLAEKNKDKLGKVSVGKSCIRFKKIEDVNLQELERILKEAEVSPGFEL